MLFIFQLIPVILALASVYACIKRLKSEQRYVDRIIMYHAVLASSILLAAQGLWWWMEYWNGTALWQPNSLWMIFDIVVMSCFIYMATYRR